MISSVSHISSFAYQKAAKPILFKFPADTVHNLIAKTGIIAQSVPPAIWLARWIWRYDNKRLEQTIVGIQFQNPVGLSAGFDKEARLPKLMHAIGFGLEEVGSITAQRYGGNPQPWYSRLPHTKSILVNSGLKSSGVREIANKADKSLKKNQKEFPINASIAKTNLPTCSTVEKGIKDYCTSFRRLEKSAWPSMYTINISCPNTSGGEPFNKPQNLKKLLTAIDQLSVDRPIFLKMPIDISWPEAKELLDVAAKSSITGITIGNLAKDRSSVDPRDKLHAKQRGNLSGAPCWAPSNSLLAHAYTTYHKRFVFIGVGGVFSAEDAYTKIRLGASLVELITGVIFEGPQLIGQINSDLVKLLEADGLKNVHEAIGVDAKKYVKELRK